MSMNGPCVFGVIDTKDQPEAESHTTKMVELFLKAFPDQKDVALKIYSETDIILPFTDSRVEIMQHSPEDKSLASWFRKLTCFISLERPQGWPILEHKALATGRPLIGARFGGITEFFSDVDGYPVEFSMVSGGKYHQDTNPAQANPDHIIELMQQVHRDRVQARQLGINGVDLVSRFTWKHFCKQLLQILELLESQ
jgi:glycosyltransferase involved in cell wall biosynthesis